jgi:hypothetical protein
VVGDSDKNRECFFVSQPGFVVEGMARKFSRSGLVGK